MDIIGNRLSRECTKCGVLHIRKTKMCNRCYVNQPSQIEKLKERGKRYYKKLSNKWHIIRENLICKRCGKKFIGKRRSKKYCSIRCQRNRKTVNDISVVECVICNKKFKQIRSDSKACSKKCKKKHYYNIRDKDKKRFYERTRDSRIRCNGGNFTYKEWQSVLKKYKYRCACCNEKNNLSIDHIIPISKGGKHEKENIQPLCIKCNSIKGVKIIRYTLSPQLALI